MKLKAGDNEAVRATLLTSYTYKPLDRGESIRILVLQPASEFLSPLAGELLHDDREHILNDLADSQQYETVSYAWGETIFTHWITLDGTARLSITANVDSMLRHLRKGHRRVRLWVDAICLNQEDAEEKAVQVQLMGEIYQHAHKLHIWLGPGDDEDAVRVFRYFQYGLRTAKSMKRDRTSVLSHVPWSSIQKLLHLSWFRRRWVIQEVELSKDITVHWATKKIPWNVFLSGLQELKTSQPRRLDPVDQGVMDAVCALGGPRSVLLQLLWTHHQAECSDHRDRLFSLFNLAKDVVDGASAASYELHHTVSSAASPRINGRAVTSYTQPWPSVYAGFVKMCLTSGYSKEILLHCCAFRSLSHYDINYPSWVPDWSVSRNDGTVMAANFGRREIDVPTLPTSQLLQGSISLTCCEHFIKIVLGGWSPSTGSDQIIYELGKIKSACRLLAMGPGQMFRMAVSDGALKDDFEETKKFSTLAYLNEVIATISNPDEVAFVRAMARHQFYICEDNFAGFGSTKLHAGDMVLGYQQDSSPLCPVLNLVGRGPSSFSGHIHRIVGYVWHYGCDSLHNIQQKKTFTLV
ncbi:hypothetical protein FKW77_006754 [Venturia effusa]|uniref:Heterokaryon incompatibility domain-containing protein n=1 Tax=Venturia effusa TaxID=50376 RepID=A0A517LJ80_9PEZI|nr:hypothetical protein FKW77_006754 [Venturia effusa]